MKKEKGQSTKDKDSWYLVTSEGTTVAMVRGLKSAKKVYSGGDSPIDKIETFEDAYREFKKRRKNEPKDKRERDDIGLEECWQFILTKDELVAIVKGYSECNKISVNYITDGGIRMVNAGTYKQLKWEIKALRENKPPHKGILKGSLLKPQQKKK